MSTHDSLVAWQTTRDGARIIGSVRVDGDCWIWERYLTPNGYGMMWFRGRKNMLAHRAAYILARGAIPDGLVLDHLCRTRACVNPAHLEAVSNRTNTMRGDTIPANYAARTHCLRGHEYTAANTATSEGYRRCRICARAWLRNKRAAVRTTLGGSP